MVPVMASFLEGAAQSPGLSMPESQRVGGGGQRNSESRAGWLAAFGEELEVTMVRSHGASVLAQVLALLPSCCVTFGKLLPTLGLSFFTRKWEGWIRPVTFK